MVQVKDGFGTGKHDSKESNGTPKTNGKDANDSSSGEQKQQEQHQQSESTHNSETLFGKLKFGASSVSPKVSLAFNKLREAKPVDLLKKGYSIVKDELEGNPHRRKHLEHDAPSESPPPNIERSTRTDVVLLPSKQSPWGKKWEAFKNKVNLLLVYCFTNHGLLWVLLRSNIFVDIIIFCFRCEDIQYSSVLLVIASP